MKNAQGDELNILDEVNAKDGETHAAYLERLNELSRAFREHIAALETKHADAVWKQQNCSLTPEADKTGEYPPGRLSWTCGSRRVSWRRLAMSSR